MVPLKKFRYSRPNGGWYWFVLDSKSAPCAQDRFVGRVGPVTLHMAERLTVIVFPGFSIISPENLRKSLSSSQVIE